MVHDMNKPLFGYPIVEVDNFPYKADSIVMQSFDDWLKEQNQKINKAFQALTAAQQEYFYRKYRNRLRYERRYAKNKVR